MDSGWPFPQERLLQLDTKLKAQLGRSDQARGRAARVDASIVEIRIGTERLVEMLTAVVNAEAKVSALEARHEVWAVWEGRSALSIQRTRAAIDAAAAEG